MFTEQFSNGDRPARPSGRLKGNIHHAAAIVLPVQVRAAENLRTWLSLARFVYEKRDDPETKTATLNILHTVFVERNRTADFTMTKLIRQHLETGCNAEDLIGLMRDKNLPVDDIEANKIAEELLTAPCEQGYLTISNALQWRLQYARVIEKAGSIDGILKLR